MSLAKKLYELQLTELAIQKQQEILDEINHQLIENPSLLKAKEELIALQHRLDQKEKQQRDLEWETEDLETNIKQLNSRLYDGSIKNPKELVSLEKEIGILKTRLKQKEEELLDLMADIEKMRNKVSTSQRQLEDLEAKWQAECAILTQRQAEVKKQLTELNQKRDSIISEIDPKTMQLYLNLRSHKGQAVVRVEQGKCQGCHITLPVSEWQRVRAGNLACCSSCGRILFLG